MFILFNQICIKSYIYIYIDIDKSFTLTYVLKKEKKRTKYRTSKPVLSVWFMQLSTYFYHIVKFITIYHFIYIYIYIYNPRNKSKGYESPIWMLNANDYRQYD